MADDTTEAPKAAKPKEVSLPLNPTYVTLTKDVKGVGKAGDTVCGTLAQTQKLVDDEGAAPAKPELLDLPGVEYVYLAAEDEA